MASHFLDRLRSLRTLLIVLAAWGLFASPAFAFVFVEPLPQSPPVPGLGAPPPIIDQGPPDWTQDGPPLTGGPVDSPPPITALASAPEPASVIAGLLGLGLVGAYGGWKRRRKS